MHNQRKLPGDLSHAQLIDRILRVNHAGEFGAKRIYEGQLALLRGRDPATKTIEHMYQQELRHLSKFEHLLPARKARPTFLYPLWNVAGFALGAITAAMGAKATMACTIAIEEVIDEHYAKQAEMLSYSPEAETESELRDTIEQFRKEEIEHRDIGIKEGGQNVPAYPILSHTIKFGSRIAIWLSERI